MKQSERKRRFTKYEKHVAKINILEDELRTEKRCAKEEADILAVEMAPVKVGERVIKKHSGKEYSISSVTGRVGWRSELEIEIKGCKIKKDGNPSKKEEYLRRFGLGAWGEEYTVVEEAYTVD